MSWLSYGEKLTPAGLGAKNKVQSPSYMAKYLEVLHERNADMRKTTLASPHFLCHNLCI